MQGTTSFEFAGHVLDLRRGRLRRGGLDVALRRKSLSLLTYLVQNSGRVLGKDELIAAIWPDVEVSEDLLSQCLKDIRKTLGSEGNGLIRTVPRRGYVVDEVRVRSFAEDPIAGKPSKAPSLPDKPSIAVLPFSNLSDNPGQEYFVDGMVEEIITALSRFNWLFVMLDRVYFPTSLRALRELNCSNARFPAMFLLGEKQHLAIVPDEFSYVRAAEVAPILSAELPLEIRTCCDERKVDVDGVGFCQFSKSAVSSIRWHMLLTRPLMWVEVGRSTNSVVSIHWYALLTCAALLAGFDQRS